MRQVFMIPPQAHYENSKPRLTEDKKVSEFLSKTPREDLRTILRMTVDYVLSEDFDPTDLVPHKFKKLEREITAYQNDLKAFLAQNENAVKIQALRDPNVEMMRLALIDIFNSIFTNRRVMRWVTHDLADLARAQELGVDFKKFEDYFKRLTKIIAPKKRKN